MIRQVYEIVNAQTGQSLGGWEAADEQGALDARARDEGYPDDATMKLAVPRGPNDLTVTLQSVAANEALADDLEPACARLTRALDALRRDVELITKRVLKAKKAKKASFPTRAMAWSAIMDLATLDALAAWKAALDSAARVRR